MMHGLDRETFDELFEKTYKPFRSRNARTLFNIFIMEKEKEYLTTLDIQAHLDDLGIDLSKKEINAWLRSLQEADLITKQQERGKPTTLTYDDKYTFDKWSLTEAGFNVSEDLNELMLGTLDGEKHPTTADIDATAVGNSAKPSMGHDVNKTVLIQDLMMTMLRRSDGKMQMSALTNELTVGRAEIEQSMSALMKQGLIDVKGRSDGGFLTRLLVALGLRAEDGEVHLTRKEPQLQA